MTDKPTAPPPVSQFDDPGVERTDKPSIWQPTPDLPSTLTTPKPWR